MSKLWWDVGNAHAQALRANTARRGGMLACGWGQRSSTAVAPLMANDKRWPRYGHVH